MTQHLTPEEIDGYRRRTLAPDKRLDVADHLARCEGCRQQVADAAEREGRLTGAFRAVQAELQSAPEEAFDHLPDEQLMAFVDGGLDEVDREIAEGHLETCARCAEEVRELRQFRALMTTYPAKVHAPAPRPTLGERLRAMMALPAFWALLSHAGTAAAAVLVFFWIGFRPQVDHERELQQQLGQSKQESARSKQEIARLSRLPQENEALIRKVAALEQQRKSPPGPPATAPASTSPKPPQVPSGPKLARNDLPDAGGELTVDARGRVAKVLPSPVQAALAGGRVTPPQKIASGSLAGRWEHTMGAADEAPKFTLRAPIATATIEDQPTFRWTPRKGATRYKVSVFKEEEDGETEPLDPKLFPTPEVAGTEWRPEARLERGKVYRWQVQAFDDTGEIDFAVSAPAPPARFWVLPKKQADALREAEQKYAGSPLTRGVLYADAGVLDRAEEEFSKVVKENPRSAVARKLLQNVRALQKAKR